MKIEKTSSALKNLKICLLDSFRQFTAMIRWDDNSYQAIVILIKIESTSKITVVYDWSVNAGWFTKISDKAFT